MIYPDNTRDYLIDLQLDLEFNRNRLEDADKEAVPVIVQNIKTIERDIARYSAILQDNRKKCRTDGNGVECPGTEEPAPQKKQRNTDFAKAPAPMKQ